jgi:hypothetical protein
MFGERVSPSVMYCVLSAVCWEGGSGARPSRGSRGLLSLSANSDHQNRLFITKMPLGKPSDPLHSFDEFSG